MDSNKLQAQVRSLTRDVGALREALRQEEKKRERLAAHAKACDEAAVGARAETKQLTYVNTKLEQELRMVREGADAAAAKNRGGLEAVRGRLSEVERSVHQRSAEACSRLQRLHSALQDLQATAMPLAAAPATNDHPGPALKSPLSQQQCGGPRDQLHRQFTALFGSLSQLAALFLGGASGGADGGLLLTAPDCSAKSVRWRDHCSAADGLPAASPAASGGASSLSGSHSGATPAAPPAAPAATSEAERERLIAEVRRLRAALAEAHQRLAAAEAGDQAGVPGGGGGGRLKAAMQQLEAVVPQYRAAAQALQGQVTVLREKLAAAGREREVAKWRGVAQQHEAALAEAAAKLHTREAQSLAASTQVQSRTDQLQLDVEGLRRRCAKLATQRQEAQRLAAQLRASLAAKEQLAATQQQTIQRLEATIQEQQADIRSALDLVTSRPGPGAIPAAGELHSGDAAQEWDNAEHGAARHAVDVFGDDNGNWAEAAGHVDFGKSGGDGWQHEQAGHGLSSLLDAATAAADAAAAWASGYGDEAAGGAGGWESDGHGGGQDWSIPAAKGLADSWMPSSSCCGPQKSSCPASPAKHAAAGMGGRPAKPPAAGCSVEADIAGLEAALRSALGDLQL